MLQAKGLEKAYEDKKVIHNIDLTCHRGEFHAIIGPSGAGKTTLLKMLAGLENPDLGQIYLDGNLLELPAHKLVRGYEEIRLVYQDYALKPNMTVYENLNYALLGYDADYKQERIEYLTELCQLQAIIRQASETLSGGQKQRVAIARALATEPEVVLMDEPFSNLDPMTKYELLQESKRIARESDTTIILVTHDTRDALEVADQMHILIAGQFAQQGIPSEVYQKPNSAEIASMFGYINLLDGKGLWAEKVTIGEGSLKGIVNQTIFKGPYQLLSIESEDHQSLLAFDFFFKYKKGQSIQYGYDPQDLITYN